MPRNVNVPPQKVYGGNPPLTLPIIQMSSAEATIMYGQPQIYDEPYPLDYSGLQIGGPWWAETGAGGTLNGLGGVGGGNVRLMPWEKGYGFSGLGAATAAQIKAAAARKAKQDAIDRATAEGLKKAQIAKAGREAAAAARKSTPASGSSSSGSKAKDYTAQINSCQNKSGTWNTSTFKCDLPPKPTAAQNKLARDRAKCQKKTGWAWNESSGTCSIVPVVDPSIAARADCEKAGGFWDAVAKACASKEQRDCRQKGGTWDSSVGVCTGPTTTPPISCPSTPSNCPVGQIIGPDANNCYICVPDPNYVPAPPTSPYPGGGSAGGGGGMPPGPLPSFDPSAGGMPGAGMPIMSQGATGGGMPMSQGQGPTAFDESSGQFDTAPVTPASEEQEGQRDEQGTTDDTANVAEGNVLESLSKMFGFGSLGCGCNKPPTWFNDGPGGNAPMLGAFAQQPVTPPVPHSTETAVYVTALVAVVGAAAIFLWSKGGRK